MQAHGCSLQQVPGSKQVSCSLSTGQVCSLLGMKAWDPVVGVGRHWRHLSADMCSTEISREALQMLVLQNVG